MIVPEELWDTLLRFHREVAMPDIAAHVTVPLREGMAASSGETNAHFDAIYARLDSSRCRVCEAQIFSECKVALPDRTPRATEVRISAGERSP